MKTMITKASAILAIVAMFAFTTIEDGMYSVVVSESTINWTGKKVTGQHNGTINLKDGNLEVVNGKIKGGSFTIDMTSIVCEDITDAETNAKLIGHLKSDDFFSVEKYNEASMVITGVKKKMSDNGNYEFTGDLTIKGQTKSITFPAQVSIEGDNVIASSTIVFDRTEFNVRYGSGSFFDDLGDNMIYDDIELKVNLTARNM